MRSFWYLRSTIFKTQDQRHFVIVKLWILHTFVHGGRNKASKYLDLRTHRASPRRAEHAWVLLHSSTTQQILQLPEAAFLNKSWLSLSVLLLSWGWEGGRVWISPGSSRPPFPALLWQLGQVQLAVMAKCFAARCISSLKHWLLYFQASVWFW